MRAAVLLLLTGCATQIREARAIQPNPVRTLGSPDDIPQSVPLYVFIRDSMDAADPLHRPAANEPGAIETPNFRQMTSTKEDVSAFSYTIPRYWQLRSSARFVVLARDRVRFHLSIVQGDERNASTKGWKVWLEDDTQRKLLPASREVAQLDRLHLGWSLYFDNQVNQFVKKREVPGWEAYQGRADYVFTAPDLMTDARKMLALVAEREGVQMRFVWRFDEGQLIQVDHYGRSRVDYEVGTMIAPSPDSKIAQTWYEGEEP
jgi:hypothetical protein